MDPMQQFVFYDTVKDGFARFTTIRRMHWSNTLDNHTLVAVKDNLVFMFRTIYHNKHDDILPYISNLSVVPVNTRTWVPDFSKAVDAKKIYSDDIKDTEEQLKAVIQKMSGGGLRGGGR